MNELLNYLAEDGLRLDIWPYTANPTHNGGIHAAIVNILDGKTTVYSTKVILTADTWANLLAALIVRTAEKVSA